MGSSQRPGLSNREAEARGEGAEALRAGPPAVPTLDAVEFIRRMRGGSQPHLLRCEDGHIYVVKFRNNPQHVRILANEMLAARIGLLIGLPAAQPAYVEVSRELIEGTPALAFEVGTRRERCAPGLQFGSRFPGDPSETLVVDFLPDRLLKKVKDLSQVFLGAFVFDKWTCNCNGRQVIFYRSADEEGSAYSAALIDHGFCFNDGDWDFPDNAMRSLYPRRLVYESVRGLQSFEPFLSIGENIDAAQLEACAAGIPDEWCGGSRKELLRLLERLYGRRKRLRQAIIDAKNSSLQPFPNWA